MALMKSFGGGKKPFFKRRALGGAQTQRPKEARTKRKPPLKYQIRSLERLVRSGRLEPKVQTIKEEELAKLEKQVEQLRRLEREKKYAKRYHHVRFFERVKIERSLSKLQKKEQQHLQQVGPPLTDEQQSRLLQLKEDLQYVMHFPKLEKYVSLLRDADTPEAQAHLEEERRRLRLLVKQQLMESAVVTEADEGRASLKQVDPILGSKRKAGSGSGQVGKPEVEEDDFFLAEVEEEPKPTAQLASRVAGGQMVPGGAQPAAKKRKQRHDGKPPLPATAAGCVAPSFVAPGAIADHKDLPTRPLHGVAQAEADEKPRPGKHMRFPADRGRGEAAAGASISSVLKDNSDGTDQVARHGGRGSDRQGRRGGGHSSGQIRGFSGQGWLPGGEGEEEEDQGTWRAAPPSQAAGVVRAAQRPAGSDSDEEEGAGSDRRDSVAAAGFSGERQRVAAASQRPTGWARDAFQEAKNGMLTSPLPAGEKGGGFRKGPGFPAPHSGRPPAVPAGGQVARFGRDAAGGLGRGGQGGGDGGPGSPCKPLKSGFFGGPKAGPGRHGGGWNGVPQAGRGRGGATAIRPGSSGCPGGPPQSTPGKLPLRKRSEGGRKRRK